MQILKNRVFVSMLIALTCLWGGRVAFAGSSTDCNTPDTTGSITTCYFDLTTSPSSTPNPATALLNGGIFQVPGASGSFGGSPIVGTGVLNPFVRIQEQANGTQWNKVDPANGIESGFNTSAQDKSSALLDDHDNGGSNWNHAIQLGDLCKVTVNGIDYYQFTLDINEQGNTKYSDNSGLSLDEFKLFYADSGSIDSWTGANDNSGYSDFMLDGATLAYNMDGPIGGTSAIGGDAGGDASILMDYQNFSGSGKGIDLQALVPVANFAGATDKSYIYLYSKFGATGDKCLNPTTSAKHGTTISGDSACYGPDGNPISTKDNPTKAGSLSMVADAGFEEWSLACKKPGCDHTVPEPQTLALMGLGVIGLILTRRRVAA